MSPKRLAIFLMLMVSWPFWLLLRSRFGEHFTVLLFLAWGTGYVTTWSLLQPGMIEHWWWAPDYQFLRQLLPLLQGLYYDSIVLWGIQLASVFFQRFGVFLGECEPPHRWYTGCFWTARNNYAVPDVIGLVAIWFILAGILSNRVDVLAKSAPWAAGIAAASFLVLAYASYLNAHNLPYGAPHRRSTSEPRRYLARLRTTASRSREGLGHIFSRRDPALARIAKQ